MNSWKSTRIVGVAPPLSTFIIGTGRTRARTPAQIAPQRLALLRRLCVGRGQRDTQDRIRAQARFVGGAIERDQRPIEGGLIGRIQAAYRLRDLAVHVGNGARHALARPSPRRHRAAPLPRTRRCSRRLARPRAHSRRRAASAPPRPCGLPRLSRIWRPWICSISLIAGAGASPAGIVKAGRADLAHRPAPVGWSCWWSTVVARGVCGVAVAVPAPVGGVACRARQGLCAPCTACSPSRRIPCGSPCGLPTSF